MCLPLIERIHKLDILLVFKKSVGMLKQARNPGMVEKRIENSDGRTDRLTDYDMTDYDMTD